MQIMLGTRQLEPLNGYLKSVSRGRNVSAYYGEVFDQQSAGVLQANGMSLFVPVKRRVGHRTQLAGSDRAV